MFSKSPRKSSKLLIAFTCIWKKKVKNAWKVKIPKMQMQNVYVFNMFPCQITGLENAKMQSVFLCLKNEAPKNEKIQIACFGFQIPRNKMQNCTSDFPVLRTYIFQWDLFHICFTRLNIQHEKRLCQICWLQGLTFSSHLHQNMRANCGRIAPVPSFATNGWNGWNSYQLFGMKKSFWPSCGILHLENVVRISPLTYIMYCTKHWGWAASLQFRAETYNFWSRFTFPNKLQPQHPTQIPKTSYQKTQFHGLYST